MDFIGLPQYCKAFLGRCDVIASSTIAKTIDPHTYISRQFLLPASFTGSNQTTSKRKQSVTFTDFHDLV